MVKACFVLLFKNQTNEVDMQNFWISLGNNFSQMHVSWSELLLDTWGSLPDLLSLSYTDWAQNLMFYWYFILLSPKFGLKYRVSFSYCLGDWKDWKYVWKYFMFATWMVNKLDHSGKSKKFQSLYCWKRRFRPGIFSSWRKCPLYNWKVALKATNVLLNFCWNFQQKVTKTKSISFALLSHNTVPKVKNWTELASPTLVMEWFGVPLPLFWNAASSKRFMHTILGGLCKKSVDWSWESPRIWSTDSLHIKG